MAGGRPMGKLHQEDVRKKIQVGQLIKTLQDHALTEGTELPYSRMKAIEILLRKSMPDLTAITLSNEPDEEFKVTVSRVELAKNVAFALRMGLEAGNPQQPKGTSRA